MFWFLKIDKGLACIFLLVICCFFFPLKNIKSIIFVIANRLFDHLWLSPLTSNPRSSRMPSAWQWKQRRACRRGKRRTSAPDPSSFFLTAIWVLVSIPPDFDRRPTKVEQRPKQENRRAKGKRHKGKKTPGLQVAMHLGCQVGLIKLPSCYQKPGRKFNAL